MTKKRAPAVDLDQPLENGYLSVTNFSDIRLSFHSVGGQSDLILAPLEEKILEPAWAQDRILRKAIASGTIQAKWVDRAYEPKSLPVMDDAPQELLGSLNQYEKNFAMQLAMEEDEADVIAVIKETQAKRLGSESMVDLNYMKDKFRGILSLLDWLERKIRNRKNVLKAIDERKDQIRAL